jgi:hypothetical protein
VAAGGSSREAAIDPAILAPRSATIIGIRIRLRRRRPEAERGGNKLSLLPPSERVFASLLDD